MTHHSNQNNPNLHNAYKVSNIDLIMSIVKLNNAPSSQKTPAERVVRSSYFDADPDRGTTLITQLQKQMMDKAE